MPTTLAVLMRPLASAVAVMTALSLRRVAAMDSEAGRSGASGVRKLAPVTSTSAYWISAACSVIGWVVRPGHTLSVATPSM